VAEQAGTEGGSEANLGIRVRAGHAGLAVNGIIRSHGEFRLLWIGETASRLGSSVTTIVLPLVAATTLHASAFTVSVLAATAWLPWLLLGLHVGPFVDRHHRRRLMIASDLTSAVLFLSVPAAAALGILTTAQLLVVAFSAGCVSVVFTTAYAAFIVDLIAAPNQRAAANGLLQGSASAVQMVGPGIGGVLAQLLGAVTALLTDSVSFIVSLLCLLRIRDHGPRERGATNTPLRRQIGDGLRFIRSDPLIRPLTLFGGTANLALVGYQSLLVVFLLRTVGLQPGYVGVVLAIASCGGLAGAALGNRLARKLGSGRALLLTKVGACPFALLVPLAAPGLRTLLVPIGGFAVGLGIVAGNVISSSFGQAYTPTELFSRVNATSNVFNYGTIPIGALLAGSLAATFGIRDAIWSMAALLSASALILLASPLRRFHRLPLSPPATGRSVAAEDTLDEISARSCAADPPASRQASIVT
jgi:MFS family permease